MKKGMHARSLKSQKEKSGCSIGQPADGSKHKAFAGL